MIQDTKNLFKRESIEDGFRKRYGKNIKVSSVFYEHEGDVFKSMDDLTVVAMDFISEKGKKYKITEYFNNGMTGKVVLQRTKGDRVINNEFKDFLHCEVTMIDRIAEE